MEAARNHSRDELENKKYSELQKISKALGIKGGRLKTDKLIEAILEAEAASAFLSEDAGNIATALAEAAVKEDESMETQDLKIMDSSGLLEDIEFPDDDLLDGLQPTPAKTPGRHNKQDLTVAIPNPQSAIKKRGRSVCPDNENVTTPDASTNATKRRRTETFVVDDEISFPNIGSDDDEISFPKMPCNNEDEISFAKDVPSQNEKVPENTQQLSLLGSQLPAKTPAQVSKRKRGRGRKPALAVQEDENSKEGEVPQIRREGTFDKDISSDLVKDEDSDCGIRNQSIVKEGTFVKDERNEPLLRENMFTKDEHECKDSTEKLSSDHDLTLPVGEMDDNITTSNCVTEFVANTEESDLPSDNIVTSNNVKEFVNLPTECKTPEIPEPQLSVKKSRSSTAPPSSARKSLASGNTPGLNRKSLAISRKSNATPLKAQNIRKSIGIMGIHVTDFKKTVDSPARARVVTPVSKASLMRKSIGTPVAKIVTPVTKINTGRKSIGTPLSVRKSIGASSGGRKSIGTPLAGNKSNGSNIQLEQKSTPIEPPVKTSINKTSTFESKLVKPTFSIGQTASTKTEQGKKQTGTGIPRFVSYARKIKMPDFSKIHEKAFKKMEALDDYQGKKHGRTRTITAGGSSKTPNTKTPSSSGPSQVFTPSVTNVKNVNLNFAESAKKRTPTNGKIATSGKKIASSKKLNNSASKITSKSPKMASKSPSGTVKTRKSPKVNVAKSPKITNKSPKTKLKPPSAKKEAPKSGIPSLKENVKPGTTNSSMLVESKIPAPKPINYRPYTGAIKAINPRKTKEDYKNLAMKNPKVKYSSQVRAENRTILKGVRINKRFELQMANRGIDLQDQS